MASVATTSFVLSSAVDCGGAIKLDGAFMHAVLAKCLLHNTHDAAVEIYACHALDLKHHHHRAFG